MLTCGSSLIMNLCSLTLWAVPLLHSFSQLPWSPCVVLHSAWIDFVQGTHYAQWDHFLYFGPMDKSQCCSAVCAASGVAVIGSLRLSFWFAVCMVSSLLP